MGRVDTSYRRIVRISAPVMLNQLAHTAMGILDTIMVGRLGVTALAGVGLGHILVWWLLSLFWGMLAGVNTLVAQAEGADDRPAAGVAFWQGLYLSGLLALLIFAYWPCIPAVLRLAGASPEVQSVATDYMRVRLLGGFGLMLGMVGENFYRGIGRTDIPMWGAFLKLGLNFCLNWVFIYGHAGAPALGPTGAALGTILSESIVGLVLVASLFAAPQLRAHYALLRTRAFHPRVFRALVAVSAPIGVQTFMEMGGISVFTAAIARLGDAQLAATDAVIQAWSMAFMLGSGLAIGATTLAGQCVGARDWGEARRAVRRVLRLGYVLMALLGAVYFLFPAGLMALFVRPEELGRLLPFARPLFSLVTIILVFDLEVMVLAGALRGAGDTTFSMVANLVGTWLFFVPATLALTPRYGLTAGWACLVTEVALLAVAMELRFRGTAWQRSPIERASLPRAA